jgi:hypothetical protein
MFILFNYDVIAIAGMMLSTFFKCTGVLTSNNGPNNVPTQPNKHISQMSRYELISLFFNAFIKTISSCCYLSNLKCTCV